MLPAAADRNGRPRRLDRGQWPKISLDAHRRVSHADLHVSFRLYLRPRIQFAAFSEDPSDGIESSQFGPFAQQMNKIHDRAIRCLFTKSAS